MNKKFYLTFFIVPLLSFLTNASLTNAQDFIESIDDKDGIENTEGVEHIETIENAERKILIEKFSGTWCGFCPNGDHIIDTLLQQYEDFIEVVVHWSDELSFFDGDSIVFEYANGSPSAAFNRKKFDDFYGVGVAWDDWDEAIDQNFGSIVPFEISTENSFNPESRILRVDVDVKSFAQISGDFRINCYIVQEEFSDPDNPLYYQTNYFNEIQDHPLEGLGDPIQDYVYKNVARAMLGGPWGTAGIIPQNTQSGQTYTTTYDYFLASEYDPNNFKVVAFVHYYNEDETQREIINASEQSFKILDTTEPMDTVVAGTDTIITNSDTIIVPIDTGIVNNDTIIVGDTIFTGNDTFIVAIDTNMVGNDTMIGTGIMASATVFVETNRKWSVYPNPAQDVLNILFKNPSNIFASIELLDLNGKVVLSKEQILPDGSLNKEITLDLNHLKNGTYLLKAVNGRDVYTEKILILK